MKSARLQELLQYYKAITTHNVNVEEDSKVKTRLFAVNSKMSRVVHAINGLKMKHIQFDDVFERVSILARDDICDFFN